jgi:HEAT repeats
MRTLLLCAACILLLSAPTGRCTGPADPSADLARLKSPDAEVRVEALRTLQTSLDPRIPEAVLPLLADEGNSIRRLAARAVGSRWWQIPKDRVPVFVAALKRNETSEFEDERNMVRRGIGLLTRNYQGKMFPRSADGRWVIYERRGLPCLIDTKSETEELLGWAPDEDDIDGRLASAWGNGETAGSVLWHDNKAIAALSIIVNRRESVVWIWQHRGGLRKIETNEILKALGGRENDMNFPGSFYVDVKGWKGDELRFEVSYSTKKGDAYSDHTAVLGWDASKNKLRVISREAGEK